MVEFGIAEVGDVCLVGESGYVRVGGPGGADVGNGEEETENGDTPAGAENSDEDGEGDELSDEG